MKGKIKMDFNKKRTDVLTTEESKEKPTPSYLRNDYPYKAVGEEIVDMSQIKDGIIYEIKCHECEMSIRSQGQNIRNTYARFKDKGCIGCGNKNLVVRMIDMSNSPKLDEAKPE